MQLPSIKGETGFQGSYSPTDVRWEGIIFLSPRVLATLKNKSYSLIGSELPMTYRYLPVTASSGGLGVGWGVSFFQW